MISQIQDLVANAGSLVDLTHLWLHTGRSTPRCEFSHILSSLSRSSAEPALMYPVSRSVTQSQLSYLCQTKYDIPPCLVISVDEIHFDFAPAESKHLVPKARRKHSVKVPTTSASCTILVGGTADGCYLPPCVWFQGCTRATKTLAPQDAMEHPIFWTVTPKGWVNEKTYALVYLRCIVGPYLEMARASNQLSPDAPRLVRWTPWRTSLRRGCATQATLDHHPR